LKPKGEVCQSFVPNRRRPRKQRRRNIGDRLERRYSTAIRSAASCARSRVSAHRRHRIADMAHPPARQRETRRHNHRIDRADLRDAGEGTDTVGAQIGFGKHPEHPAAVLRRRSVDPLDCSMPMRRAQHMSMHLPGQSEIVDVAATAGQKPEILQPADRAPAIFGLHPSLVPCGAGVRMARRRATR
jgi:hypothetical protein